MPYAVTSLQLAEHRPVLMDLWRENFEEPELVEYIKERFAWLYEDSPGDVARTWIAIETGSREAVGCGSLFWLNKWFRGQRLRGGVPVVFAVSKKHRVAAAALAIQRSIATDSCHAGVDVLVGKPNEQATPILERIGYVTLGAPSTWVKDTEPSAPAVRQDRSHYADEVAIAADERFDRLWSIARNRYDEVIGERASAFLNWRYSGFTEFGYRFYCLVHRGDRRLVGYIAFHAWHEGFMIADIFCEDPRGRLLDELLLGFEARMVMEGSAWIAITYLGAPWFEERISRLGFTVSAERRDDVMVYLNPSVPPETRADIVDKNKWFMVQGETHVFL